MAIAMGTGSTGKVSTAPDFGSSITAFFRLLFYVAFTLPCMPLQALAVKFNWPLRKRLPRWYHRQCCRILGLQVQIVGQPSKVHPTLFAANHVSYLDITVLSSLLPMSFIAKSEVARWPFFGWLAKLQETIFVERRARKAMTDRDEMTKRLERGDDLTLFPEGTSGDGQWVLPFKSALFSVAEKSYGSTPLYVQPVSITYTRLDGAPMGRYLRPLFAWFGDMELASHLWQALRMGLVTVVVEFHPPKTLEELGSRKKMSDYCYELVSNGVSEALAGRRFGKGQTKTA